MQSNVKASKTTSKYVDSLNTVQSTRIQRVQAVGKQGLFIREGGLGTLGQSSAFYAEQVCQEVNKCILN